MKPSVILNWIVALLRKLLAGIASGLSVGALCCLFSYAASYATAFRASYPWLNYLLPVGGLLIVALYSFWKDKEDTGANLVLQSIRTGSNLPIHKVPELFAATWLSHLFGASVGRMGASIQMGGSLAHNIGRLLRFDKDDSRTITMSGVSAAFSVIFGAPLAGAFFGMEVANVGHFYYPALLPCAIASLTASFLARACGISALSYPLPSLPAFEPKTALYVLGVAALCAAMSAIFCLALQLAGRLHKKFVRNPYLRIFIGGALFLALYYVAEKDVAGGYYHGAGLEFVPQAMNALLPARAFLLKTVLTAVAVGAGFKGGEISPAIFTGAAFGALCASFFGMSAPLCAAIGVVAMFVGVTNCPVSGLLFAFSLFGVEGAPYWMIAVALGYALSGRHSLYEAQEIVDGK